MAGRSAVGFLLAAALLGLLQTALSFQVKDRDGKLCLSANFSMRFTVEFDTKSSKKQNVNFTLPSEAHEMDVSTCGNQKTPEEILVIGFGKGHSINMTFEKKASLYVVSALAFKFNLNDSSLFPNSSGGELKEVKNGTDIQAVLNTKYVCFSNKSITGGKVSVFLSNVTIEAYVTNDTLSKNDTVCYEDRPTSSPVITTHLPSTHIPSTTVVTTTSVPPSLKPEVGQYSINDSSGMCLLASMALQVNLTYSAQNKTILSKVLNIPPNAKSFGKCDNNTVTLNVTFGSTNISLNFAQNSSTEKYFLHGILLSAYLPEAKDKNFSASNNSLSALRTTIGKSYKCVAEEIIQVSDKAALNIYNVQVQAFKIAGYKFGAVEECQLDENNMLIPIVVGAALAGLVLIVLIAYLIGRKRSHAGYQTI